LSSTTQPQNAELAGVGERAGLDVMSALASSRHGALNAPGLFSRKMESCLIFIGSPFSGLQDAFYQ